MPSAEAGVTVGGSSAVLSNRSQRHALCRRWQALGQSPFDGVEKLWLLQNKA
jgi:hypothetical protein